MTLHRVVASADTRRMTSTPAAPAVSPPAVPTDAVPTDAEPEPVLNSTLVIPAPKLESELVDPPTEPSRCGTQEGLDEWR